MLVYRIEHSFPKLSIRIEEKGSRRHLYLDTLKALAKSEDREALGLLTKIHLRSPNVSRSLDTATFQLIELPKEHLLEALKLLLKTGRLHYKNLKLQGEWEIPAKMYWKEEGDLFAAVLQWKNHEIPLEECDLVFPQFALWKETLFPLSTHVSWKWIEPFLKGKIVLEKVLKKKFLEEDPPIFKKKEIETPFSVLPELVLSDSTGCFANLRMEYAGVGKIPFEDFSKTIGGKLRLKSEEEAFEKDLLEAGFIRKIHDSSHYYCPGDKVLQNLRFLLEIGWKIFTSDGKKIERQTSISWELREEKGKVAIQGKVHFQDREISLKSALGSRGFLLALDHQSAALFDRKPFSPLEGEWEEETLFIKKSKLPQVAEIIQNDPAKWENNLLNLAQGLKEGAALSEVLPGLGFQGNLLPYQQKGVNFLSFLQKWGFSAFLADEMGLGKTVQVLAFFSTLRTNLPILIIAPSSLLYQWKAEIQKFLPSMPVCIHAGLNRQKDLSQIQGVVITSYAILRQDEELLSEREFEVIVLDESNAIKTAATQTAKAACQLRGRFKIALSGTPVENRFEELLSQFKFLMPDFDAPHLESLKKQIRPFLLRRKKSQVELELPEKMEQITWVEMGDEQRALYESYLTEVQRDLSNLSERRMEILEKILRLRQICADPRLLGHTIVGSKLDVMLDDIEGRKVLIYSQFTSMLDLIGDALQKRGQKFLRLDGSTPLSERERQVKRFQEDPNETIFLLSLKAGGTGLNLNAADYVILFDPWWNEAVEAQAIDRAHRIGQKKSLIAKRYLVFNSIEEKMLRLKEKKRNLAEHLLNSDDFSWTEEDLLHLLT